MGSNTLDYGCHAIYRHAQLPLYSWHVFPGQAPLCLEQGRSENLSHLPLPPQVKHGVGVGIGVAVGVIIGVEVGVGVEESTVIVVGGVNCV